MIPLLLAIDAPAQACTWWWQIQGFDPLVATADGVPTDARVVVRINGNAVRFDVVPLAGGAPVPGAIAWFPNPIQEEMRLEFTPDTPLSPWTAYRADVFVEGYPEYDPAVPVASTTFTTGADVAPPPVAATLLAASAGPWTLDTSDRWYCVIGSDVTFRTVTLEVDLPATPRWSWLVVRGGDEVQHVEPLDGIAGVRTIAFDQVDVRPGDCFTVALRMPDGEEAEGAELCLPPEDTGSVAGTGETGGPLPIGDTADPVDTGSGAAVSACGCATGFAPGPLVLVGLALLARRRR